MSSPGTSAGAFYRSHTSERNLYKTHVVKAADCPHITQEHIAYIIEKYGEDHPFTRSSIYAEFMDEGDTGVVIPMRLIDGLRSVMVLPVMGDRHAFCDFAAGGDEKSTRTARRSARRKPSRPPIEKISLLTTPPPLINKPATQQRLYEIYVAPMALK